MTRQPTAVSAAPLLLLLPLLLSLASVPPLLAGCAGAPPARTASRDGADEGGDADGLASQVEALRARVKARLSAQAALYWKTWTSGEALDAKADPDADDAVVSAEAVAQVDALRKRVREPAQVRALAMLRAYLAAELAAREAAPASEALAVALARATVSVEGEAMALRDAEVSLAGESHPARRRAIGRASMPALRALLPLAAERDRQLDRALQRLGYPDARAFAAELRQIDLPQMARLAEGLLVASERAWRRGLEELARGRLSMPLAELRRPDLPRAFRTGDFDAGFPRASMEPRLRGLLGSTGLLPQPLAGLQIDAEARLQKRPRALALPVALPGDVRLSLRPADGLIAFSQALHELGHAVQFALVRDPQFEFANLGTEPQGEAVAYLFEGLADDPDYLAAAGVPAEKVEAQARLGGLRRLLAARLEAGRVLCEVARAGSEGPEAEESCRLAVSRAYGFPVEAEEALRYVAEGENLLASAERLRGMVLAAQLERSLVGAFGERWWSDARVAARLAQLLGPGSRTRFESWIGQLGATQLEAASLVQRLERQATYRRSE